MVSLDCCHKRRLSVVSGVVDSCSALLNEKDCGLEVTVVCGSEERSHFGLLRQFVVQQIWPFLQNILYVVVLLPVDVVEQVFAV